jgi:hypothetical protein
MMVVREILRAFRLIDVERVLNLFCTRILSINFMIFQPNRTFFASGKIGLLEAGGTAQLSVSVDSPENMVRSQVGSWKSSGLTIILAGEAARVVRVIHTRWVLIIFI